MRFKDKNPPDSPITEMLFLQNKPHFASRVKIYKYLKIMYLRK